MPHQTANLFRRSNYLIMKLKVKLLSCFAIILLLSACGITETDVSPTTEEYSYPKPSLQSLPAISESEYTSIELKDYDFKEDELTGKVLPDFENLDLNALIAYNLNMDGAMAEGSSEELHRRFLSTPQAVVDGIANLGDQPSPHFQDMKAAEQLCRDIARYNVFMTSSLNDISEFDAALESLDNECQTEPESEVINRLRALHNEAIESNQ